MKIFLILLTSFVLMSQFIVDFLVESKKKKIIIGIIILSIGLGALCITYRLQVFEKKDSDLRHNREIKAQQRRFDRIDSLNNILTGKLDIRNEDLKYITSQSDTLKIKLERIEETQNKFLTISRLTANEVFKKEEEKTGIKSKVSRGISQVDKVEMIKILRLYQNKNVTITSLMGDSESFQFAYELKEVFETSGWIVNGVNQALYTKPVKNVVIAVKSESYPVRVNGIFNSLKLLSIIPEGQLNPKLGIDDIEIIIGAI